MPKVLIYTPTFGTPSTASVSLGYHLALYQFARDTKVELLEARYFTECDLVRARSRAVRLFLQESDATHLLHWDSDVVGDSSMASAALQNMIASGHDLVGAPYPRKKVRWDRVARAAAEGARAPGQLEIAAYEYPYGLLGGVDGQSAEVEVKQGCLEVDYMSFGFTLTSRNCLERMWSAYAPTLSFGDYFEYDVAWTVALFQLLIPWQNPSPPYSVGPMLSEDYSFCSRWKAIGGKVMMYIGPGSPMHHVGPALFRGAREGLVRT
jgi:hypothetical protein